jgi:hypothetical protein
LFKTKTDFSPLEFRQSFNWCIILPNNNPLRGGNLASGEIGEALALDFSNEKRNLLLVARSANKPEQLYNNLAKSLASMHNT